MINTRTHWREHQRELATRWSIHEQLLIVSDFDGTLSPIVAHPNEASLAPGAADVLRALVALQPRLRMAILSGRALLDLDKRLPLGLDGLIIGGNHGLEIREAGMDWTHPYGASARPDMDALLAQLRPLVASAPGAEIEDKELSLTLHYRRVVPTQLEPLLCAVEQLGLPSSIQRKDAKMAIEFRPNLLWHKGYALRRLMERLGVRASSVVYIGDDTTDESAFLELGGHGTTIYVGSLTDPSAASWSADDPADVVELLSTMACVMASV